MHMIVDAEHSPPVRRPNPVVRLFSSLRFGITTLVLILVYATIGSGLAPVRGALEMTEMQVFQHWIFLVLLALFCISLIAATLTRIRFNALNAGVLTVHTGLLVLVAGAALYFGRKVEGDVLLITPRIELLASTRNASPLAALPAEQGARWAQFMPAFGGAVLLEIADLQGQPGTSGRVAVIKATFGNTAPRSIKVSADAPRPTELENGLALRWRTFPAQARFYDQDIPALYYSARGAHTPHCAALPGLPLHRERYLPDDGILHDTDGREVPSKRTSPHLALGALQLPTGWLEPWRMPIHVDAPELPFDVDVTGYVPYVAGTESGVADDGPVPNPIIEFRLSAGNQSVTQALAALDPQRAQVDLGLPMDFRWVASAEEFDAAVRPLLGPAELEIEVREPPVRQTVAISSGQTIAIPGTAYELTVGGLLPSWPLVSPGFEGARSPVAMISIKAPDKSYQRTVIERFPQFTQDIDEQGKRHTAGPYDPNLILRYRTALDGRVSIVAGPELPPTLAAFQANGTVQRFPLTAGVPQPLGLPAFSVDFTLLAMHTHGRWIDQPLIQPVDRRRPNVGREPSAIRLKLTGHGDLAGWTDTRWCFYSPYPDLDAPGSPPSLAAQPTTVRLPDGRAFDLIYARAARDLDATLVPGRLKVKFFPGRRGAEAWQSDFFVQTANGAQPTPASVKTNQTYTVAGWTLFQSGADPEHWGWTILGVGNRHGIWTMAAGCVLITVGCLYAFYVKPILRRRRAAAAGAQPRAHQAARTTEPLAAGTEA